MEYELNQISQWYADEKVQVKGLVEFYDHLRQDVIVIW